MKALSFILLVGLLVSCNNQTSTVTETEVTEPVVETTKVVSGKYGPAMFKAKMDEFKNVQLVDVRTPEELAENGSIAGAENFNFYADDFVTQINTLKKEEAVFLYCRSGKRSASATKQLLEMGFTQVYDLEGGYNAWLQTYN